MGSRSSGRTRRALRAARRLLRGNTTPLAMLSTLLVSSMLCLRTVAVQPRPEFPLRQGHLPNPPLDQTVGLDRSSSLPPRLHLPRSDPTSPSTGSPARPFFHQMLRIPITRSDVVTIPFIFRFPPGHLFVHSTDHSIPVRRLPRRFLRLSHSVSSSVALLSHSSLPGTFLFSSQLRRPIPIRLVSLCFGSPPFPFTSFHDLDLRSSMLLSGGFP